MDVMLLGEYSRSLKRTEQIRRDSYEHFSFSTAH
jgi:hypothetical protein